MCRVESKIFLSIFLLGPKSAKPCKYLIHSKNLMRELNLKLNTTGTTDPNSTSNC